MGCRHLNHQAKEQPQATPILPHSNQNLPVPQFPLLENVTNFKYQSSLKSKSSPCKTQENECEESSEVKCTTKFIINNHGSSHLLTQSPIFYDHKAIILMPSIKSIHQRNIQHISIIYKSLLKYLHISCMLVVQIKQGRFLVSKKQTKTVKLFYFII